MFKFFGVGEKNNENGHDEIVVDTAEETASDEDVGQVAVDILELPESIVIVAPLAGMEVDNVDIAISKNVLTISGNRVKPSVYEEAEKILVEECFFGPFSRSVILPENLAFNKIRATMENNLLFVDIPKLQFPSKNIKINKLEG
jgi:HSP20 family protein